MNTYKKYCPNVFVAQCKEKHEKGEKILVKTKYGKENECIVHNFVGYTGTKENQMYCYSITRSDGIDNRDIAENKAYRLNGFSESAKKRRDDLFKQSNEGKDFLSLAEPIKIGHHSEKRHRALIDRNHRRMEKAFLEDRKADSYISRIEYCEKMSKKIDLSMPESLEFFKIQLEEATQYHKGLKDGSIEREHSYSLTYANNKVKELNKKYEIAKKLWS